MRTSEEFFGALRPRPRLARVVVGELYFEYHRGTYTSQARTKRGNRRGEQALHDAEFCCACRWAGEYPAGARGASGRRSCCNQFHDILPGSSIGEVHARAERDLAEVEAGGGGAAGPAAAARRS